MPRERPAITSLLALLPPDGFLPDPEELEIAGRAAIDAELIDPGQGMEALRALSAAARGASLAREGLATLVDEVEFRMSQIAFEASIIVSGDYVGSRFETCLGPIPEEVRKRVACATERPALARILMRSAADHLAAAVMDLALRIPGAVEEMRTDGPVVRWRCAATNNEGIEECRQWLGVPGPAEFARPRLAASGQLPTEFPHWDGENEPGRFALVLDPDDVEALGGSRRWGVVILTGDEAEHGFHDDHADVYRSTLGLPMVSLGRGGRQAAIVPFEIEMEAISILADAAIQEGIEHATPVESVSKPIEARTIDFTPLTPPSYGGLAVTVNQYGLDLTITPGLAEVLGWHAESRIALGYSARGGQIEIARWQEGPALLECFEGLETAHTLPLPLELAPVGDVRMIEPPYLIENGRIILSITSLQSDIRSSKTSVEDPGLAPDLVRSAATSPRALILSGLAGFVIGTAVTLLLVLQ